MEEIVKLNQQLSQTITLEELLTNYNPRACLKTLNGVNTVALSLQSNAPTIGAISRGIGLLKSEAFIKVWVINLSESINCTRPLKEHQIDEVAELIIDGYKLSLIHI